MKTITSGRRPGFTLAEIMIVVAILALLAAIVIPNYFKAKQSDQRRTCIANLRQIEGAKAALASVSKEPDTTPISFASLAPFATNNQGQTLTWTCPAGGTYAYGTFIKPVTCPEVGHEIPK